MKLYHEVEWFFEPTKILEGYENECIEMNQFDHGFLCGMIKLFRPNKIVEIGVAGGGTTAVIQRCVELLKMNSEFISVDISEQCYKQQDKDTGYIFTELVKEYDDVTNHRFILGKTYGDCADEIGDNIDFVVLDTVHAMPGEILDFLYALPRLKKEAIVIIHDVSINLLGSSNWQMFCNRILFDTVKARKYYNVKRGCLSNIAAFQITDDTKKYVLDVFSSLGISWNYLPEMPILLKYRKFYKVHYDKMCIDVFDSFIERQIYHIVEKIYDSDKIKEILDRLFLGGDTPVFIYGAGKWGGALQSYIDDNSLGRVEGFVISDNEMDKLSEKKEHIYRLSDIRNTKAKVIIAARDRSIIFNAIEANLDFVCLPEWFYKGLEKGNII